ncbi:MAG: UDP-N-acetylmuramyl-tripeptide synthetase [Candidatus Sungbacteria bacterium]|nr:UDP-N-acetylmuramyl-tripeptide synthetase [Candidatus Sungbacteria bacterium]
MNSLLRFIKRFLPASLVAFLRPSYHMSVAFLAAFFYRFPSRGLVVVGVTGTNGKSTVVELLHSILMGAGIPVASASSIRFKINDAEEQNRLKMTMPGRFALQKFLSRAKRAGCRHVILEITSEGIRQFRNRFIFFSAAVLTNVTPEHIESHGGFEKYIKEKLKFFEQTSKNNGALIVNGDDPNKGRFLAFPAHTKYIYDNSSIRARTNREEKRKEISGLRIAGDGIHFVFDGVQFSSPLLGAFNASNIFAALSAALFLGIPAGAVAETLKKVSGVPGRFEFIQKEPFAVIVDYAHTPDALQKVYETIHTSILQKTGSKMLCVLGAAGGGRDKWKRLELGKIADVYCSEIILTDEDPYDESPLSILSDIEKGFSKHRTAKKILDRREAIRASLASARPGDCVIITGKGAEPFIMGPNNTKMAWDDRDTVTQELQRL